MSAINYENNSVIALAIATNGSIATKSARKIKGGMVVRPTFETLSEVECKGWNANVIAGKFAIYAYWEVCNRHGIKDARHANVSDELKAELERKEAEAKAALKNILRALGEVHGQPLRYTGQMLQEIKEKSWMNKTTLIGNAKDKSEEVSALRKAVKDSTNDDDVAALESANKELSELKKGVGSGEVETKERNDSAFILDVEEILRPYITERYAKTPEQIEAERAERKAQQKENAKRNRQKNRQKKAEEEAAKKAAEQSQEVAEAK